MNSLSEKICQLCTEQLGSNVAKVKFKISTSTSTFLSFISYLTQSWQICQNEVEDEKLDYIS